MQQDIDTLKNPCPIFTTQKNVPGTVYVPDLDAPCDRRITMRFHVSCKMSNPQIDPDGEGMPRQDPVDGRFLITTGGLNRHVRDVLKNVYGSRLYIDKGVSLENQRRIAVLEKLNVDLKTIVSDKPSDEATENGEEAEPESSPDPAVESKAKGKGTKGKASKGNGNNKNRMDEGLRISAIKAVLETYADLGLFGGPLHPPLNYEVKGTLQTTFGESYHTSTVPEIVVAPGHVQTDKLKEKQDRNLGTSYFVRFCLLHWTQTAFSMHAKNNGVTFRMINRDVHAQQIMWKEHTSGQRPDMRFQRADIFVHKSEIGDCSDTRIEAMTTPKLVGDLAMQAHPEPSSMADYDMDFKVTGLPEGMVHLVRLAD